MRWRRTRTEPPAIKAAKAERKRSERSHKEALALARELEAIREENHFAESLRRIMEGL